MYIVSWLSDGECEVACDSKGVFALVSLLEASKRDYFVSNRTGKLSQRVFGVGGFNYWLGPQDTFNETLLMGMLK